LNDQTDAMIIWTEKDFMNQFIKNFQVDFQWPLSGQVLSDIGQSCGRCANCA
jgi:hypothetical protein